MLVSVVFHHHQPWYIDRRGRFCFGWIFDHTVNYMRHLELVKSRDTRLTYNLSPTLLRQWKIMSGGSWQVSPDVRQPDISFQSARAAELLEGYRERDGKNIEILSQPFYHPIMPLLLKHGLDEDLNWQLSAGRRETEEYAGRKVEGMWSPECAFSLGAAAAAVSGGFRYTVLDGSALGGGLTPDRPYAIRGMTAFFRDNEISNAFSFRWPMLSPEAMKGELEALLLSRQREGRKSVVVALDGENWMNGSDHLGAMADALDALPGIESATLSDIIREVESGGDVPVSDTSWALDHSFSTWEGSRAKDQQWALIDEARDAISGASRSDGVEEAREYLRIAEGSDYTYWDFDRPGALAIFGMSYASAARDTALRAALNA